MTHMGWDEIKALSSQPNLVFYLRLLSRRFDIVNQMPDDGPGQPQSLIPQAFYSLDEILKLRPQMRPLINQHRYIVHVQFGMISKQLNEAADLKFAAHSGYHRTGSFPVKEQGIR